MRLENAALATERVERRLAAILAADVAGYSRLMSVDEEDTHERLKAHFRQLIDPKISEHRGRIVKNTGDGMLAEFPSVVEAVRCAAEIQRGMIDHGSDIPEDRRIGFRIGVNLGDVIVEPEDIFGDGVNIAARAGGLSRAGRHLHLAGGARPDPRQAPIRSRTWEAARQKLSRPVRVFALSAAAVASLPAVSVATDADIYPGRRTFVSDRSG
jgi:class 3 adenylate cyclase